jgi:small subunit ribosomal protein S6e
VFKQGLKTQITTNIYKMAFKINISDKGKSHKLETESEAIIGKKIGETIQGKEIAPELQGYELEITGTSDIAGIPGFKGLEGNAYHRRLLTLGPGMKNRQKGLRLKKTNRGEEISLKTSQINLIVKKQGEKKFDELIKPSEEAPAKVEATEEKKEEEPEDKKEEPEKKEKAPEKPAEEKQEVPEPKTA